MLLAAAPPVADVDGAIFVWRSNSMGCFHCGHHALGSLPPATWWRISLPDRTEWLCSAEYVYLSYPWKFSKKQVYLKDHTGNLASFGAALEQLMDRG
jgi:hypothetical protein